MMFHVQLFHNESCHVVTKNVTHINNFFMNNLQVFLESFLKSLKHVMTSP